MLASAWVTASDEGPWRTSRASRQGVAVSDTRYFGSLHLAVLAGEAVMQGYYTGFLSDIEVDAMRWKWVRLDAVTLSGVELAGVVLKEPDVIYDVLEHSAEPLALSAIVEQPI
jgi:hypothetical protein